ncbi:hypothetical protein YC2023_101269 [Brassica napus]
MNPMFYFLLALTTVLAVTAGPVLDTDGDIIFHGSYYAIPLPADIKRGGLDLLPDLDHQCPLYVTMSGRLFKKLTRACKIYFYDFYNEIYPRLNSRFRLIQP